MSQAFGNIRSIRSRVTEDVRAWTTDCDREVKSQYRQEVAHGRNLRSQEKLRLESISTRRETGVKTEETKEFDCRVLLCVLGSE